MSEKDELKRFIIELAKKRGSEKTICPSDAARKYDPEHWRDLMEAVRQAAAALHKQGKIAVEQNGEGVNFQDAYGPVRLRYQDNQ